MMLAKFILNDQGNPVSVFTREPCALSVGTTIKISKDFYMGNGITLSRGEEGIVTFAGLYAAGMAAIEVLLLTPHRGLAYDDNKILLEPFITEDILPSIICLDTA